MVEQAMKRCLAMVSLALLLTLAPVTEASAGKSFFSFHGGSFSFHGGHFGLHHGFHHFGLHPHDPHQFKHFHRPFFHRGFPDHRFRGTFFFSADPPHVSESFKVWVAGQWVWVDNHWEWVPGHWVFVDP